MSWLTLIFWLNIFYACSRLHTSQAAATAKDQQFRGSIEYSFQHVDYTWPDSVTRQKAVQDGRYIVENNIITGIKVFGNHVFVTVPRWRNGVPATLNVLVNGRSNRTILWPYPSWNMNVIGDCKAFQYVQSMEVDPNTGRMWIIDTGRVNTMLPQNMQQNLCPPKLVVLDIRTGAVIHTYTFPADAVPPDANFLNDIVLDYKDGRAIYAYITDTARGVIVAYDVDNNTTYVFEHDSMKTQPLLPRQHDLIAANVDGIAMSPDFKYLYYCTLPALGLYAVPTSVLRSGNVSSFAENLIFVGNKTGGSDGMIFGQESLFYGAFEDNAVYSAKVGTDGLVALDTQKELVHNDESVSWVDTFAINNTDLWFVANKLNRFAKNQMVFTGAETNMYIWKVDVQQYGYLHEASRRTSFWPVIPGIVG